MARRIFAIASFISLILCAAFVTMWVRSYSVCITVMGTSWVKSWEGEIEFVRMLELSGPADLSEHGSLGESITPDPPKPVELFIKPSGALLIEPTAFGFGHKDDTHFVMQDDRFYESSWNCYVIPYWLFVATTAALPSVWVLNRRRVRRLTARLDRAAQIHAERQLPA